ncbi:hypothetical protein J4G37_11150 [Microvirga sp. 3-52]|nr:hypothetical protein [Microvirga sp. 3-52]
MFRSHHDQPALPAADPLPGCESGPCGLMREGVPPAREYRWRATTPSGGTPIRRGECPEDAVKMQPAPKRHAADDSAQTPRPTVRHAPSRPIIPAPGRIPGGGVASARSGSVVEGDADSDIRADPDGSTGPEPLSMPRFPPSLRNSRRDSMSISSPE